MTMYDQTKVADLEHTPTAKRNLTNGNRRTRWLM